VIQSFACKDTAAVFAGRDCPRFRNIRPALERKLMMLDAAHTLADLKAAPSNHLEKLSRELARHHSIRVNIQYRLIFVWTPPGPVDVACVDYH
jgi:toxin HigB-1